MQQFILYPALSTLTSILLFFGCYKLGFLLVNFFQLKKIINKVSVLEFSYFLFGIVFLLIILFPLVAFTNEAKIILRIFGYLLCFLGIYFFFDLKEIFYKIKLIKDKNIFFYIFLCFILLYFLLSLAPLTAADVVDYHAGTALNILNYNKYILQSEWFTGLQAGSGEILIALGFSIGSEQFGSMIQFSSLLTISGVILKFSKKYEIFRDKYFLSITIFTCPILLFLLSGNKPQIFFSSIILFSLSLNFIEFEKKRDIYLAYLIINILVSCAVIGKFSYNLVGGLVWLFSTVNFYLKIKKLKFFFIPIVVFLIIYFPFIIWKYINLGGNIFTYFYSPFPLHLPGYETFFNHNKGSQEIPFPFFLLYTTPSRITEYLAANTILFFILLINLNKNKNIFSITILSLLFLIISNLFAYPSARYYLDVILWLTLGICFLKKLRFKRFIKVIFIPQVLVVFLILIYSCYNFLPGAFSKKKYIEVKNKHAYLFEGMSWVNDTIPDNSKVLIINRGFSLYKDAPISGSFNYFTNNEEAKFYKKKIKKYNIQYVVYLGPEPQLMHLKNCVGEIYKYKKNVGFHATRNPFNKGGPYNAYIFNFDNDKLPDC